MNKLVLLSLLLALNSGCVAEEKQHELQLSEVSLQFAFVRAAGQLNFERVSVTVTNPGPRSGTFRLPSPFVAEEPEGFAPFPPYLAMRVKEPKTGKEEGFVFTSLRKPAGPGEVVFLKAGQTKSVEYSLMLFYRWGPGSPKAGNFRECIKPGDDELEVRAEIFVVEKNGSRNLLSNPQTLRCSFPEWLFTEGSLRDVAPTHPEADRIDTKPNGKSGRTVESPH